MPAATQVYEVDASIQRIADVAMADRRLVKKALSGQFVAGRDGERIAVALRALGIPCVITPDLALRPKNGHVAHTDNPMGGTRCHLSAASPTGAFCAGRTGKTLSISRR